MHEVNVGHKTLADYRSIVPGELMAEIDELAAALRGKRVLHVNATAFGGGVPRSSTLWCRSPPTPASRPSGR